MGEWTQMVLTGGPGCSKSAEEVEELSCCQEVREEQGRALCRGSAGHGSVPQCHQCSQAQLWQQRCSWYISPAERVAVLLALVTPEQSRWVQGASVLKEYLLLLLVHSSCFVCKYPLLLAPTSVTSYLEMCFCWGARAQLSPWKAESHSGEKWQTRSDSVCYVRGKNAGSCSPCSTSRGTACSPWPGVGEPGQPWLFGNASCVLPHPPSICCRLRWHPSHAGITSVITIS